MRTLGKCASASRGYSIVYDSDSCTRRTGAVVGLQGMLARKSKGDPNRTRDAVLHAYEVELGRNGYCV